jgi:hypothetical protein
MTCRWHELAAAMRNSNMPASDKHVFGYLLSTADFGTGELPARFTPTRKVICRKTSLSRTQVFYSTRHLERHGWLSAKGATGPGRPLEYGFALGRDCDCTGRVHAPQTVPTETVPTVSTVSTGDGNGVSGWHRSVSTNSVNAAGQTANHTERSTEGGEERKAEREPLCIGGCGKPARHGCSTCWDHARLELAL